MVLKFRPTHSPFGCCSLLVGVELSCLLAFNIQFFLVVIASSNAQQRVLGIRLPAATQIAISTWAAIGIPTTVCAAMGALYRVEHLVRMFFWYLVASVPVGLFIPTWLVASGGLCDAMITKEIQRMGSAFVCGFAETGVFMGTMISLLFHLYVIYVIWSAAEDYKEMDFQAVSKMNLKFENAGKMELKSIKEPYTSYGTTHPAVDMYSTAADAEAAMLAAQRQEMERAAAAAAAEAALAAAQAQQAASGPGTPASPFKSSGPMTEEQRAQLAREFQAEAASIRLDSETVASHARASGILLDATFGSAPTSPTGLDATFGSAPSPTGIDATFGSGMPTSPTAAPATPRSQTVLT
eukprot:TRINITY_DN2049_c0_g1_i2.p1 TRINITY_DN2049_c0_g1~~TRINITY_DN2049_c0_g1_i2.p1  ORF type:complete len:353 (+),score=82.29 TRINITY_DN2049_c0_g1_i2:153-1211(+)